MQKIDPNAFELFRRDPFLFFINLQVDGPDYTVLPWGKLMVPQQKADFQGIAPMLSWAVGVSGKPEKHKAWIQKSRGYSKTTDIAAILAYLVVYAPKKLMIDVYADDKEQAQLSLDQLSKIVDLNPWLTQFVDVQRRAVIGKKNGTVVTFMSRDSGSAFGRTPDFTICDELTHWRDESMWNVANSSQAKKNTPLIIACNAGYGRGWQWKVREIARTGETWYFSCPLGPAPWQTEANMAEQQASLPYNEFRRLWHNEWQSASGLYLMLEEAEACVDPTLVKRSCAPDDGLFYVASIDYAEKVDRTVCTVGHLSDGVIIIDRMDVIDPKTQPDGICRVDWVRKWMYQVRADFGMAHGTVVFILDPYGLNSIIQEDSGNLSIFPVDPRKDNFSYRMAYTLRHLVLHQKVRWYPGCGEIMTPEGGTYRPRGERDDLCTELADLEVKVSADNKWRFDHTTGKHNDRAWSLGTLCLAITSDTEGDVEWGVTPPELDGTFNWLVA